MVQNAPAKKKLWGSKVDEIVFLLGCWGFRYKVYIHFARMKRQEGVGMHEGTVMVAIESQHENKNRSESMVSGICELQYNGL
jgi:hypothetical protein